MELLRSVLVVLISAFVGYFISIWRSRVLPWINMIAISESRQASESIKIPSELQTITKTSYRCNTLMSDEPILDDLYDGLMRAKVFSLRKDQCLPDLKEGIDKLRSETGDVRQTVINLLNISEIANAAETALWQRAIDCTFDPNLPRRINFEFSGDEGGRFLFDLEHSVLPFGQNISSRAFKKDTLLPFVELVARLQRKELLSFFEKLLPIFEKQVTIHERLIQLAEPIIEAHTHWNTRLYLTNFGESPFLVLPNAARLVVEGEAIRSLSLSCDLLETIEPGRSEKGFRPIHSILLVPPGSTRELAIVTQRVQQDLMQNGQNVGLTLRAAWESGNAKARAFLRVRGREIPWTFEICGDWMKFSSRSVN